MIAEPTVASAVFHLQRHFGRLEKILSRGEEEIKAVIRESDVQAAYSFSIDSRGSAAALLASLLLEGDFAMAISCKIMIWGTSIVAAFLISPTASAMPLLDREGCAIQLTSEPEMTTVSEQTDELTRVIEYGLRTRITHPYLLGRRYLNSRRVDGKYDIWEYFIVQCELDAFMRAKAENRSYTPQEARYWENLEALRKEARKFVGQYPHLRNLLIEQWRFAIRKLAFESVKLNPNAKDKQLTSVVNKSPREGF